MRRGLRTSVLRNFKLIFKEKDAKEQVLEFLKKNPGWRFYYKAGVIALGHSS